MLKRILGRQKNAIDELPILVLMPHSRCNCRCVMCDIWKANNEKKEISEALLERHLADFRKLKVKRVALSGGEALMHSNLWKLCEYLHDLGIKISLLTTGITLGHHAREVIAHCDDVIVSLDGSRDIHNAVRNLPAAFEKLEAGVLALKKINPEFRVTARTVIQKSNFRDLPNILKTARALGFDQISFLAADVSSSAFNRPEPWKDEKISAVALSLQEVAELDKIIRQSFHDFSDDYKSGFIAENQDKMGAIVAYYRASAGTGEYPKKKCNAPWVSAVVESSGDVLPCFFHPAFGNLHTTGLENIINSSSAIDFRKNLDVNKDPICMKCVCSLYVSSPAAVN